MALTHLSSFLSIAFFLILTLVCLLLPAKDILFVDEHVHYAQIESIFRGTFRLDTRLTTLPGFHIVLAFFATLFQTLSIPVLRIFINVIAISTVVCFAFVDRRLNGRVNIIKLGAFFFMPLLFPFYFLIYTDIFSLLLFLISMLVGLNKKYQLSAIIGICNLFVRQNTFFWYEFSFIYFFLVHYQTFTIQNLISYLSNSWVFIVGNLLFFFFVLVNNGVSMGEKDMHPGNSINLGNIFFFLFLLGVFLLPFKLQTLRRFSLKQAISILLVFTLFLYSFKVDHPYNEVGDGLFLRNQLLSFFSLNYTTKTIFFIPIIAGIIFLRDYWLTNKKLYNMYFLIGGITLLPNWLIEQRYYFIHFTLLILFSLNERTTKRTILVILVNVLLSLILVFGIFNKQWFP